MPLLTHGGRDSILALRSPGCSCSGPLWRVALTGTRPFFVLVGHLLSPTRLAKDFASPYLLIKQVSQFLAVLHMEQARCIEGAGDQLYSGRVLEALINLAKAPIVCCGLQ